MRRTSLASVSVLITLFLVACGQKPAQTLPAVKMLPVEGFPLRVIQAFKNQEKKFSAPRPGMGFGRVQAVVAKSKKWGPNHVITIAFQGGSAELRKQIADATKPWSDAANIQLDFGSGAPVGQYREWSNTDTDYAADVRIGFAEAGYWSYVARDGIDTSIVKPNEESMNFSGFTDQALPADWQSVVLHEFGHALGFEHEHQNPNGSCESDFRWDNDPDYAPTQDVYGQFIPDGQGRRPGIYTVLGGPLNNWTKDQIDFNLRALPSTLDVVFTAFDDSSIMKYHFDDWMYKNGRASHCYSAENLTLSSEDKQAALEFYPRSSSQMLAAVTDQVHAINDLLTFKSLTSGDRLRYQASSMAVRKEFRSNSAKSVK